MRRPWGRLAALGLPLALVGFVAVLVVQVQLARGGARLGGPPLDLDRQVGRGPELALRVLWLGDSTAAGVGVDDPADALPTVVAAALGRPVELSVLAVSGDRVGDVVDDQLPASGPVEADVVFVSVGANDVTHLTSRDDFAARYRALLGRLPSSAEVVLLGVPDMGAVPRLAQPLRAVAGFRGRQLDEVVREVAADTGAAYVGIAAATGPTFRAEPGRMFAVDEYHPSAAGYRLWADAVLSRVPSLSSG